GQQPVEERRPRVADVKLARGAWCESDAHVLPAGLKTRPTYCRPGLQTRRDRSATACTAIESPTPIESTPSLVFPFTLTLDASIPSARARFAHIASTCVMSRGRCAMTVTSTLTTAKPARRTTSPA